MRSLVLTAALLTAGFTLSAQDLAISEAEFSLEIGEDVLFNEVFLQNNGTDSLEVAVELDVSCYDQMDELKIQVCMGIYCWDPRNTDGIWDSENFALLTLAPGQSTGELSFKQFFEGDMGSQWRFYFFDRNNPEDRVMVELNVGACDSANAITEAPALEASPAYPNPAHNTVNIDFNVSASPVKLQVFDLVGNVVKDLTLETTQGTAKLDVSDLNNGVYFYNLTVNGHRSEVKSLVVSH